MSLITESRSERCVVEDSDVTLCLGRCAMHVVQLLSRPLHLRSPQILTPQELQRESADSVVEHMEH